jgi:hypothetical protein
MRRVVSAAVRLALMVAILAVVRELLMDRTSERGLDGDQPLIGSLDTWPEVPRKP